MSKRWRKREKRWFIFPRRYGSVRYKCDNCGTDNEIKKLPRKYGPFVVKCIYCKKLNKFYLAKVIW